MNAPLICAVAHADEKARCEGAPMAGVYQLYGLDLELVLCAEHTNWFAARYRASRDASRRGK